ncbi:acyl transferase/acyl hydrolase/lysophospholipase [Mycena epipterygia]|nr:acyl transferase/acyl hydrolase/lysophospholipase [Mycena epipterygia]
MSTLPKHSRDLGVRVLSLDGGGAGVLSELLILERMMYRIQVEGRLDTQPSPCECFELIGGSGTGGIIVLMLGRLQMSVKDTISAYETLRPHFKIGFGQEFQTGRFEDSLKKIFKEEQMKNVGTDACKTFVCAINQSNMQAAIPVLFRSYDTPEEPASNYMLWEVARATSATPGLFKPMEIGLGGMKQHYIDGGLGNNNPTSLVLEEAKMMHPTQPIVLISSIGSGHPDTIQISQPSRLSTIAKALKMIATDCEKTHQETARRFRGLPNTYFHFNVEQGMQGLEAQYWGKLSEMSAHTDAYLRTSDTKSKLTEAVRVILNPAVPVPASESPFYASVCPPPTFHFTGRQDILQKMLKYFNTDVGQRHVLLLYGLGGAGKSQIAFKFVEMSAFSTPHFSDIYIIDSSTQQTIENDLVTLALAKHIGKTAKDSLHWLSHQHKEWLIIFNNADNIHLDLGEFFPSGSHENIIITSRNPNLTHLAQAEHKVDPTELEDAIDILLITARNDSMAPENREIGRQIVQVF